MNLTIVGVDKTISNLTRLEEGIASEKPMQQATQLVTREARKNTSVDLGMTRASITPSVESRGNEVIGIVGSNRKSALWVEKGTRPHWPPVQALEGWARRHGAVAFLVARAISRRGTKAHHMLENALEDNRRKIIQFFEDYNRQITKEAND